MKESDKAVALDVLRLLCACPACGEMRDPSAFRTESRRWLECSECRKGRLQGTRDAREITGGIPRHDRYEAQKTRNPRKHLLFRVKYRATEEGIPFALTVEDIFIPTHCPVLGIKLKPVGQQPVEDTTPSLDRLKPELGYVRGNVAVISMRANRMKGDSTIAELETLLAWMRAQGVK